MNSNFIGFVFLVMGILVFIITNIVFLVKEGQSIGKRIVGIKIVSEEHNCVPEPLELIFMRCVIPMALSATGIFYLIDLICGLYSEKNKCIHDSLAKTLVVECKDMMPSRRESQCR